MKAFLVLLVLAGGGFAAWRFWGAPKQPDPAGQPSPFATAQTPGQTTEVPGEPPAAVAETLAKADKLWDEAAAGGADPATGAKAVELGRLYTQALQAIYNVPGQSALERRIVETRLTPIGQQVFFSPNTFSGAGAGLVDVYTVQPGDSLDAIAKRTGMSYQHINKLRRRSNIEDGNIKPGETFKVIRTKENGGSSVHVDKSDFTLDVVVGGVFAKRYAISHGAPETPTPLGKTVITQIEYNPAWTAPDGIVYQPGDERNILGGVWMAFAQDGIGKSGIGIHGFTGKDGTIGAGKLVSNGCIRMGNDDVKELSYLIGRYNAGNIKVELAP